MLFHRFFREPIRVFPALLGGHIEVISDTSGWAPLVDAGKFQLLATWGYKRSARYPNAVTVRETGYDVVCPAPIGLIGPKGMPKPIVARVHETGSGQGGDAS